jgi:hypothetical protein
MDEQPPPQMPPAPDASVAPPVRPGSVTAAAIVLIVIGGLVALLGLLIVLAGSLLSGVGGTAFSGQFANFPAAVAGLIVVIGAIFVAFGVLEVFAGIYLLPGRPWARITAIVVSVLGGLVSLGGVLDGRGANGGIVIPLIFLVGYAYVIWAVSANGRWFATR